MRAFVSEHGRAGWFRPDQDAGHRLFRARHAGEAQGVGQPLRHEDPGQAEGGQAEAGGAHAQREAHLAGHRLPLPSQAGVLVQGTVEDRAAE